MRSRLVVCQTLVIVLFLIGALSLASFVPAKADQSITPSAILANPGKYNGQHLIVTGVVERIQAKVSQKGNDYDIFDLCDTHCIRVFVFGDLSIYEGEHLSVRGKYSEVTHVSGYTFYNEIRADDGSL